MAPATAQLRVPLSQRIATLDERIANLRDEQERHQREAMAAPVVDFEAYVEVQTDFAQSIHELILDRDELLEAGWVD